MHLLLRSGHMARQTTSSRKNTELDAEVYVHPLMQRMWRHVCTPSRELVERRVDWRIVLLFTSLYRGDKLLEMK